MKLFLIFTVSLFILGCSNVCPNLKESNNSWPFLGWDTNISDISPRTNIISEPIFKDF